MGLSLVALRLVFSHLCSASAFIIGRVIAACNFVHVVMPLEYSLAAITSNFSPSQCLIGRVVTWRLEVGGDSWKGLVCFSF